MATIWTIVLVTSLIAIVGFARAGSVIFWKSASVPGQSDPPPAGSAVPIAAAGALLAGMVALSAFAGPVTGYLEVAAAELYNPAAYITAVLGPEALAAR